MNSRKGHIMKTFGWICGAVFCGADQNLDRLLSLGLYLICSAADFDRFANVDIKGTESGSRMTVCQHPEPFLNSLFNV
jgi:hypothetical protein